MTRVKTAGIVALIVAYVATGLVVVEPNEKVIVRRVGKASPRPLEPGLHLDLPWGLAAFDRLRVEETKQIAVGARADAPEATDDNGGIDTAATGRFLTGDQNLVNLELTVQYTVRDPLRYLFGARDPSAAIAAAAESILTDAVAKRTVDEILLQAQATLGQDVAGRLQLVLDGPDYDVGVTIRSVNLSAAPPIEVAEAFLDVDKARSDRLKKINDAYAYEKRTEHETQAIVEQTLNLARAYAVQRKAESTSQARRFEQLLAAYQSSPARDAARRRLFLDTVEAILPKVKKVVVEKQPPGKAVDLGVLPP